MKKEKIPLAIIYKEDGHIIIDLSDDSDRSYEIYGFLKCLVKKWEEDLIDSMEETERGE